MIQSDGGYDGADGFRRIDDGEVRPSVALVTAVADYTGVRPVDLPPLRYEVDPEAIDDLFDSTRSSERRLAISYAGVRVTVSDDGTIRVADLED